jgi:formiminotransferase-cyclodeaminase
MQQGQTLADCSLGEVIEAIASDRIAPGSGSAAAVGLALAAACAGKAVAISCKHHPNSALARAKDLLTQIAVHALAGADEDASRFHAFIGKQDSCSAHELLDAAHRLRQLGSTLIRAIEECSADILPNVQADITAARALCNAFFQIETNNLIDNQRAANQVLARAE